MAKPTAGERFWAKVDKTASPDGCWLWTAALFQGYGRFGDHGKTWLAHRFAFELLARPIPAGLCLDHLCRNRACVNPAHLEPVTWRENLLRGTGLPARMAAKTHCDNGHEFTAGNTYITPKGRSCRACHRLQERERYRRTHGQLKD